jgi:pimeloyl-ACP methyl ester carboxylesterase
MAVLRISVGECAAGRAEPAIRAALAHIAPEAPVAVLVHGFRLPGANWRPCPERHVFAPLERFAGAPRWPGRLGLGGEAGLAISFEWPARGGLRAVFRRTGAAAAALAALMLALRRAAPCARLTLIGHSMGAEVVLGALGALPVPVADAAVLLAAAACRTRAHRAAASAGGRGCAILNVTSAENDPYDRLLSALLRGLIEATPAAGLGAARANWTDLALDDPATLAALAALGHPLRPTDGRVCHLSTYTRPGALELYGALIHGRPTPERLALALRAGGRVPAPAPRAALVQGVADAAGAGVTMP